MSLIATAPRLMAALLRANLTFGMYAVLCAIAQYPDITQAGIQRWYGIHKNSLKRHCEGLYHCGLIAITTPPVHHRGRPAHQYRITSAGASALVKIQTLITEPQPS